MKTPQNKKMKTLSEAIGTLVDEAKIMASLEGRDKEIILDRFQNNLSYKAIGTKLKVSLERIRQIESRIFRKIRWQMHINKSYPELNGLDSRSYNFLLDNQNFVTKYGDGSNLFSKEGLIKFFREHKPTAMRNCGALTRERIFKHFGITQADIEVTCPHCKRPY